MTCKYYDCGFCYAPEDAKNNSIQGGCFEPEYCATYLMQNKPMMTEKEHLECEIYELELEIKKHNEAIQNLNNIKERRTQKLKEMNNTQKNTNEATESNPQNNNWNYKVMMEKIHYPLLEVVDENTVKIEGVEYKKVEKPKPQTLYNAFCEDTAFTLSKKTACDIVRGWLIDHTVIETEDAEKVTFTIHKEQLQTPNETIKPMFLHFG